MATETVKSTAITNADATPALATSKGEQGPFRGKVVDAFVSLTTGVTVGSKYLFFRVPSNAIVKALGIRVAALGAGSAADFGVYYADDARYIAPGQVAGAVISASFFKAAVDLSAALPSWTDITAGNTLGGAGLNKLFQPLWQALGLASDPGGHFDIVATSTATINTGGKLYATLDYVE